MNRSEVPGDVDRQPSRREERAHRILDAAAALILRWGYNKTAIDDVARQAGVAKGTIYLHWKTREDLFRALAIRENLRGIEDLKRRLAADPEGYTLRAVLKHSALALMKRPLLKALLLQDTDVLGRLAQGARTGAATSEKLAGFATYLELLRARGLVRTDMSQQRQTYVLTAAFLGSFLVAPLLPDELTLSDEELAETMAETVHRALEDDRPVPAALQQEVSDAFAVYLDRYVSLLRHHLQVELARAPAGRADAGE